MTVFHKLWHQLKTYEAFKVEHWVALRNAFGLAAALLVGVAFHQPSLPLYLGLGALIVSYSDGVDSYRFRARRMLAAALLSMVATLMASLVAFNPWLATLFAVLWAFVAGLAVVLETSTADMWAIGIVMFIIFSAHPIPIGEATQASVCTLIGGLLQIALAVARSPAKRYQPERRALARLFTEISLLASLQVSNRGTPIGSSESTRAAQALSSLTAASREEALLYRSLLTQAERVRISLISISRLRRRLEREAGTLSHERMISSGLEGAQKILLNIGQALSTDDLLKDTSAGFEMLSRLAQQLKNDAQGSPGTFSGAVIEDLIYQVESLMGQLRAAAGLTESTSPLAKIAVPVRERGRTLQKKFAETWTVLRSNFTFRSSSFRHAVRLAVCVFIGETLFRYLNIERGYWIPMTAAIVLKPDFSATISRSLLRMIGTLVGLSIATLLLHYLTLTPEFKIPIEISLSVFFMYLLRSYGAANYGLFALMTTGVVVSLFSISGAPPIALILARGQNTVIGGLIALAGYFLWPTWERTQFSRTFAKLLESYAAYLKSYRTGHEIERARLNGRVARARVLAAYARWGQEPRRHPELRAKQGVVLEALSACCNRWVHAVMALETAPPRPQVSPEADQAANDFFNAVELTLSLLVRTLLREEIARRDYPNLRALYENWVLVERWQSKPAHLFEIEIDRLTNATNTLREQVWEWRRLENVRRASEDSATLVAGGQ